MKKRWILLGMVGLLLLGVVGCSNPKRDALDTNIQEQMQEGTLDRS